MAERRALLILLLAASAALAQEPTITRPLHYSQNRGWNDVGRSPIYQVIVMATVTPSGFPTLVFVERDGVREPMTRLEHPAFPDLYGFWQRADGAPGGPWRIVAERGDAKSAPVMTPPLAKPQQLPFVKDLRVRGKGARPKLDWKLPDLSRYDIDRIRVAVLGGERVQGRFLSTLFVSDALRPDATSYAIPAGVLAPGSRYVFEVLLEDLEDGALQNGSSSFSRAYTVAK